MNETNMDKQRALLSGHGNRPLARGDSASVPPGKPATRVSPLENENRRPSHAGLRARLGRRLAPSAEILRAGREER